MLGLPRTWRQRLPLAVALASAFMRPCSMLALLTLTILDLQKHGCSGGGMTPPYILLSERSNSIKCSPSQHQTDNVA